VSKNSKSALDSFVSALEEFSVRIQKFVTDFLESILRFMNDTAGWIEKAYKRICKFLDRFFSALIRLVGALGKISLLYIPSLILLILYFSLQSWMCLFLAIAWAGMLTMVGLNYKKRLRVRK
jgi:hypothetical protein